MQRQADSTRQVGGAHGVSVRAALLLVLLCLVDPVLAQGARSQLPGQNNLIEQAGEQEGDEVRTRVSRREASDLAREAFPGRVLSIRLENRHWRVRMDQEGTVFNVLVDADSGDVTRSQD